MVLQIANYEIDISSKSTAGEKFRFDIKKLRQLTKRQQVCCLEPVYLEKLNNIQKNGKSHHHFFWQTSAVSVWVNINLSDMWDHRKISAQNSETWRQLWQLQNGDLSFSRIDFHEVIFTGKCRNAQSCWDR